MKFLNTEYKGRWPYYRDFKRCKATKGTLTTEPKKGFGLWPNYEKYCGDHADYADRRLDSSKVWKANESIIQLFPKAFMIDYIDVVEVLLRLAIPTDDSYPLIFDSPGGLAKLHKLKFEMKASKIFISKEKRDTEQQLQQETKSLIDRSAAAVKIGAGSASGSATADAPKTAKTPKVAKAKAKGKKKGQPKGKPMKPLVTTKIVDAFARPTVRTSDGSSHNTWFVDDAIHVISLCVRTVVAKKKSPPSADVVLDLLALKIVFGLEGVVITAYLIEDAKQIGDPLPFASLKSLEDWDVDQKRHKPTQFKDYTKLRNAVALHIFASSDCMEGLADLADELTPAPQSDPANTGADDDEADEPDDDADMFELADEVANDEYAKRAIKSISDAMRRQTDILNNLKVLVDESPACAYNEFRNLHVNYVKMKLALSKQCCGDDYVTALISGKSDVSACFAHLLTDIYNIVESVISPGLQRIIILLHEFHGNAALKRNSLSKSGVTAGSAGGLDSAFAQTLAPMSDKLARAFGPIVQTSATLDYLVRLRATYVHALLHEAYVHIQKVVSTLTVNVPLQTSFASYLSMGLRFVDSCLEHVLCVDATADKRQPSMLVFSKIFDRAHDLSETKFRQKTDDDWKSLEDTERVRILVVLVKSLIR